MTVPVNAGRWYIVATSAGGSQARVTLHTQPRTGRKLRSLPDRRAYYNPQRSGHGIFVSQAAGQQVVYWYTYLEDGTPVWYAACAARPVRIIRSGRRRCTR